MTKEPWNKHTPGDPMPCKCRDSIVEVRMRDGMDGADPAHYWDWGEIKDAPDSEITDWCFVERKGEDVIPADPYDDLEWDEDGIATVVLKKPGRPEWVQIDDRVRFWASGTFVADGEVGVWPDYFAFQIKRRPILKPVEPQILLLLSEATDTEAIAIRSAARRANIKVPE